MSKKTFKRSLALGALMAFVITGSAMAAEIDSLFTGGPYSFKNESEVFNVTNGGLGHTSVVVEAKEVNITSPSNGINAYGHVNVFALGDININSKSNGIMLHPDSSNSSQGVTIEAGGTLTFSGTGYGIHSERGTVNIDAANIVVTNTNGITNNGSGDMRLDATGDISVNTSGYHSVISLGAGGIEINADGDITITNSGTYSSSTAVRSGKGDVEINAAGNTIVEGTVKAEGAGDIDIDFNGKESKLTGDILTQGTGSTSIGFNDGATWEVTGASEVTNLTGDGGVVEIQNADANVTVTNNDTKNLSLTANGTTNDALNGDISKLVENNKDLLNEDSNKSVVMEAGDIVGEVTAELDDELAVVKDSVKEATNKANQAIGEAGVAAKAHWRAHMNDMNKRMGELRNANGEHGVWVRMVRGESEYEGAKMQYNQYQLGYDEKLSVDKRWTVGAAVTFSEGDGSFLNGSTEDDSTAFAIYGSKLNEDGTFVDLIGRYAKMDSDVTIGADKADYGVNGYSLSAEFGKRIQQGNGLWIEPQVELTYGSVDSANYVIGGKEVNVGDMDSFIARAGFALGKDIKQGNVYARASYLYDFDGETDSTFSMGGVTRTIEEDLGGGWWEVGVGANINLSKATYIYADIEKTFGGEVDTNWQWNLGVRYSF